MFRFLVILLVLTLTPTFLYAEGCDTPAKCYAQTIDELKAARAEIAAAVDKLIAKYEATAVLEETTQALVKQYETRLKQIEEAYTQKLAATSKIADLSLHSAQQYEQQIKALLVELREKTLPKLIAAISASSKGDVGIGTKTPSAKLEVVGKVKANNIGSIFIRWGNATAPEGTTLLYSGFGFNGHYTHKGSGAEAICMKSGDPGASGPGSSHGDLLYPLGTGGAPMPPGIPAQKELKCAVCYAEGPSFEMWGSWTCPKGWRAAYTGYGMGAFYDHVHQSNRHCVDNTNFDGSVANPNWGGIWYGTVLHANQDVGIYKTNRYVKCALCAKDQ